MNRSSSSPRTALLTLLGVSALGVSALAACADDAPAFPPGGKIPVAAGDGGEVAPPGSPGDIQAKQAYAEKLYREIEPGLKNACGKQCHELGQFNPEPAKFLEGPDSYVSIRKFPGIVVRDAYQSSLLTHGAHAGPSMAATPELEEKTRKWLESEAVAITAAKLPGTDPFAVKTGANEVDLTKAAQGGLSGVKLKFDASLIGGILSLKNLKLVAPAGTDVHVNTPRFVRVLAKADPKAPEIVDASFSNLDQTVQQGTETLLGPGAVFFSGEGWTPFDLASDKLRFDAVKLEKGTYQTPPQIKKCKDPGAFGNTILPALRGQGVGGGSNCASCHGAGLAGLSLNGNDNQAMCDSVLGKLNETNLPTSILLQKAATAGVAHTGGKVGNTQGFIDLFVNNKAIFF
ncbi:MAG TPA: hypothetical protein PLR99_16670 [Polyangiaceae bacterium]|nr:hypothetical protein [Polyangiaceae bacterium]